MSVETVAGATRADPGVAYFESLSDAFECAVAAMGGAVEHDLIMAGLRVRVRCAGGAMSRALLSPFRHLEAPSGGSPALAIEVFDTASTGVEPPPPPWALPAAEPGTNPIARLETERFCLLGAAGTGAIMAADVRAGSAVFHLPDAGRVPAGERAAPLREALHVLMSPRRRWLIHAGAVGDRGRGVLLVGRGGSGKSTLALACAMTGMEFVGDDYLLLELGDSPVAHAMQSTVRMTEDSAERLGLSSGLRGGPMSFEPTLGGPSKALLDVGAFAPERLRSRLSVGAIVAPVVSIADEPRLERIAAARGLRALAPSSVLQLRSGSAAMLAALGELVRLVPCYSLSLAPDAFANAAAVADLVDSLG